MKDIAIACLVLLISCCRSHALSISSVASPRDVVDVANLRYNEWLKHTTTSKSAFAQATAEIMEERQGAIVLLARLESGIPVGTAELSPLEMEHVVPEYCMYVTDVVTCQEHRRIGVGRALMEYVEATARNLGVKELFLHVEHDSTARLFYQGLGWVPPQRDDLDKHRLAVNAGTVGQFLLSKVLEPLPLSLTEKSNKVAGTGFGFTVPPSPKKKKRSK